MKGVTPVDDGQHAEPRLVSKAGLRKRRPQKNFPHSPKIPLDTPAVVESTYVHHRHSEPEAQATGARSPPERSPAALPAADDGGKTSARCSHRSTPGKTQSDGCHADSFRRAGNAPSSQGAAPGELPLRRFFKRPTARHHHHTTRHTNDVARHGGHHSGVTK